MSWTVAGLPVIEGVLSHPASGAWSASVTLAADQVSGQVQLVLPTLTLQGTVLTAGYFGGRVRARLQGGRGHLLDAVPGQHWRSATGRLVAESLCASVGEQLDPKSDSGPLSTVLPNWNVFGSTFGRTLSELAQELGCSWWVTSEGLVHLGSHPWVDATPDVVVQDEHHDKGLLLLALTADTVAPGTTFRGQRIHAVDHELSATAWRARVRYAASGAEVEHPGDAQFRELVQHTQLRTIPPLDAVVTAQNGDGTVDLELSKADAARRSWELDRGLQGVPLTLQGCFAVKVVPGARVVLEFLDSDRKKPIVRTIISGILQEGTVDAVQQLAIGPTAASVALGKALKPVVSVGDATDPVVNGKPALISAAANTVVKV